MSLLFSESSTNLVNFGSAAALDNLARGTFLGWFYPTTVANAFRTFAGKAGSNQIALHRRGIAGGGSMLRMYVTRATTEQNATSATATLTANAWQFLAGTWDVTDGGPKVYRGTLAALVSDVTDTSADGSGAKGDDSAVAVHVGTTPGASESPGMRCAMFQMHNTDLLLAQLIEQQFFPHPLASTLIYCQLGYAGTGTQPDWSGNGNNGTVTGATVTPDHVPMRPIFHAGRAWSGAFTAAAAAALPYQPWLLRAPVLAQ